MARILAPTLLAVGLAVLIGAAVAQPFGARGVPHRIVSLNLCLDQLVLMLADPADVASVTWLARDPRASVMAEAAARVPLLNHGLAEEVLPLQPDLVLAGEYTAPFAVRMLRRSGYNVEGLAAPLDLAGVRGQVELIGALVRQPERAATVLAAMDAKLTAALPAPLAARVSALVVQPGGFTAGPGAFEHELLTAAGLEDAAARLGIRGYGYVSLEHLLIAQPRIVVAAAYDTRHPSLAEAMLSHPALAKAAAATVVVRMPANLWDCAGPMNADAVALLAAARDGLH